VRFRKAGIKFILNEVFKAVPAKYVFARRLESLVFRLSLHADETEHLCH
jgi:hypothetical protein